MPEEVTALSRRRFLTTGSAWALFLAAHGMLAKAGLAAGVGAEPEGGRHLIASLRLATAAPLAEMKAFYAEAIGFPVVGEGPGEVTFQAGGTRLTFEAAAGDIGVPFYHFAFNIPQNKILQAREWQLRRSGLLVPDAHLRDPEMPEDVIHFRNWNAHSVFFWDPAGNLVEYIARHDLNNDEPGPFDVEDLHYASEIGLITDDVPTLAAELKSALGLGSYRPGNEKFHALGDEEGLVIVFRRGRKWGWSSPRKRTADIYPTRVGLSGARTARHTPRGLPYEISSKPSAKNPQTSSR